MPHKTLFSNKDFEGELNKNLQNNNNKTMHGKAAARLLGTLLVVTLILSTACFHRSADVAYAEGEDNSVNTKQSQDTSFIYDTPISDLAEATTYYDNKTVQVEGEVIGDCISDETDPDYCWITLTSLDLNTHTVGVYMTKQDAEQIDTYGAYGVTGTRLRVRGTFHLACEQHSGISGMHATNVTAVEKGSVNQQDINISAFLPGAFTVALGLVLFLLYKILKKHNR